MSVILAACGGFLLAVLWMDLMFDVQVLRWRATDDLPEATLASIAGYYRRVTTEARPMGHAVGLVMSVAAVTAIVQLVRGGAPRWIGIGSLLLCASPIALAAVRVYPNAVRLAGRQDPPAEQSALARAICRDHLLCLGAIVTFLALQVVAAPR